MFWNSWIIPFSLLQCCSMSNSLPSGFPISSPNVDFSFLLVFSESTFLVFVSVPSKSLILILFHHASASEIVTKSLRRSHAFGSAKFRKRKTNKIFDRTKASFHQIGNILRRKCRSLGRERDEIWMSFEKCDK